MSSKSPLLHCGAMDLMISLQLAFLFVPLCFLGLILVLVFFTFLTFWPRLCCLKETGTLFL